MTGPRLTRVFRAQLRDLRVLARESRWALMLFSFVVVGGTLLQMFLSTSPDTGQHPGVGLALFATLALFFFQPVLPYPQEWQLQALFLLVPIIGLSSVVNGVVSFGAALVNKKERGQKWQVAMASTYSEHVVVCGLGKLGFRVVAELQKLGRDVVCVEENASGKFVERTLALGVPVIIGDARQGEHLTKAGVERADAIIPCTDNELANLDIALDARERNPRIKVVMRMFDQELAARVEKGFGIHTAFSTSALAAPLFAAAAMRLKARQAFYVNDVLLHVSQIAIEPPSQLVGWSVERLQNDLQLKVISHESAGGATLFPGPDLRFQPGDKVTVMAPQQELVRLSELNGSRARTRAAPRRPARRG